MHGISKTSSQGGTCKKDNDIAPPDCAVWKFRKEGLDNCASCVMSVSTLQSDVNRCTVDLQHAVNNDVDSDLLSQQIDKVANLNTKLRKLMKLNGMDSIRKQNTVLCIRTAITLAGVARLVSPHGCPLLIDINSLKDCNAAKDLDAWIVGPDGADDFMRDILMVMSTSKDPISDECKRGRFNVLIPPRLLYGLQTICGHAFEGCKSLTILDGAGRIGSSAFM